jgi:TPR repeat protein
VRTADTIGSGHDLYAWPAGTETEPTTNAVRTIHKFDYGRPCLPILADMADAAEFADAKYAAASKKKAGYKAAFELQHQRALAGDDEAQLKLGLLYFSGHGCPIDTNQARIWLQKAADQGNTNAITELRLLGMRIANSGRPQ